MNILVLHDVQNKNFLKAVESAVLLQGCVMRVVRLEEAFDRSVFSSPLTAFDDITHMVYLYDGTSEDLAAFSFFAGYALGREIKVILVEFSPLKSLPENCIHLGMRLSIDQFESFLAAEHERFKAEDAKRIARERLLARGISPFPENFATIVATGEAENVGLFIQAGFDPNMTDAKGNPLLTIAVRSQYPEVARVLLDAGAEVDRLSGDRGYSPLMDAAQKGDQVMASLLLSRGARTDLRSKDGQTALILCAGRGDVPLCSLLVGQGSDPELTDNLGMSAVSYAKLFKNQELLALFNKTAP